jgi:septal ring factor EnvC (AmiA/AmiB activator)
MKSKLGTTQREIAELDRQLRAIIDDQTRLRANLEKVPPTSAAYKRYLEKFDSQETEIEKLQDQTKKLRASEEHQRKDYEGYLVSLNVE